MYSLSLCFLSFESQIARHWNTSDISSSTSMMVHHSTTSPSNVWVCTDVRLAAHTQQQLEQELGAKLVNRCILLWTATACSTACCWCAHSIGLPCFPNTARLPACYSLNCSWCVGGEVVLWWTIMDVELLKHQSQRCFNVLLFRIQRRGNTATGYTLQLLVQY